VREGRSERGEAGLGRQGEGEQSGRQMGEREKDTADGGRENVPETKVLIATRKNRN